MSLNASTVVHTAEGEAKVFAGAVAKFIVAHPRVAAAIALAIGFAAGTLLHLGH